MNKKITHALFAGILGVVGLGVVAAIWYVSQPTTEPVPVVNFATKQVNTAAKVDEVTNTDVEVALEVEAEPEEPQPRPSHAPLATSGQVHLRAYADSNEGLVPSVYSYNPADWSQSSLDWVGSSNEYAFGATDDTVFYSTALSGDGSSMELYSFNKQSSEATELVAGEVGHALSAIVSADGQTIIYRDQCGFFCVDDSADTTTTVFQYDVATGEQRELWSETEVMQGFKTPQYWLDANTVVLEPGYESTSGPQTIAEIYLLNVNSGELETLRLGNGVRAYDFSPDRSQVALAVFNYDQDDNVVDSAVQVMSVSSGEKEIVTQSSEEYYANVRWENGNSLFVFTQAVESVEIGLGEYVHGPHSIQRLSLDGSLELLLDITGEDVALYGMVNNGLYYLVTDYSLPPDLGSYNQFYVFDPQTGQSTSLLVSDNNISLIGSVHKY